MPGRFSQTGPVVNSYNNSFSVKQITRYDPLWRGVPIVVSDKKFRIISDAKLMRPPAGGNT